MPLRTNIWGEWWEEGQLLWELPPHLLSSWRSHLSGTQGISPIVPSLCLLITTATHTWGLELASSVRLAEHLDES